MVLKRFGLLGAGAALALTPPPVVHATLAAAAGTVFESVPFVLAGALFPQGRFRVLASLAGCGCRGLPGSAALSLPAFGLCVVAFGWPSAIARTVAALAIGHLLQRRTAHRVALGSPGGRDGRVWGVRVSISAQLGSIAGLSLAGAYCGEVLRRAAAGSWHPGTPDSLLQSVALIAPALIVGGVLGALAPCATAGVALASVLRSIHPALACGALCFAGFDAGQRHAGDHPEPRDTRFALATIAGACCVLVMSDRAGLVNPRLFVPIGLSATALVLLVLYRYSNAREGPPRSHDLIAPALLTSALVLGSPPPSGPVASALDDVTAGERFAMTGIVGNHGHAVARAAITCCRADARWIGFALAHPLSMRDGTWVSIDGIAVGEGPRLVIATARAVAVPPPRDQFLYW